MAALASRQAFGGSALADVAAFVLDPVAAPAGTAHPGKIDTDPLLARVASHSRRVAAVVRREWLLRHRLDPDYQPDPADVRLSVAMASPPVLRQLARAIGLFLAAPVLRKVIRRDHRVQLDTWMSADDWRLVKRHAAKFEAPPGLSFDGGGLDVLESQLLAAGEACLVRFSQSLDDQLSRRMSIRLSSLCADPRAELAPGQLRAFDDMAPERIGELVMTVVEGLTA